MSKYTPENRICQACWSKKAEIFKKTSHARGKKQFQELYYSGEKQKDNQTNIQEKQK